MHDLIVIGLSFLLGLASGFMGAISAGGALVSITGLIFLGLTPAAAIATSRLDAFAGEFASFFNFKKAGLIQWKYTFSFLIVAAAGGYIGSQLLLEVNEDAMQKAVGILLLLLVPVLVINKNFGSRARKRSKDRQQVGLFMIFLVAIYSALFGGAAGIFAIYTLVYFYGMSFLKANANRKLMGMFAT
jgi:uncharacterized protein